MKGLIPGSFGLVMLTVLPSSGVETRKEGRKVRSFVPSWGSALPSEQIPCVWCGRICVCAGVGGSGCAGVWVCGCVGVDVGPHTDSGITRACV